MALFHGISLRRKSGETVRARLVRIRLSFYNIVTAYKLGLNGLMTFILRARLVCYIPSKARFVCIHVSTTPFLDVKHRNYGFENGTEI